MTGPGSIPADFDVGLYLRGTSCAPSGREGRRKRAPGAISLLGTALADD
jgi:hypothetical protein